jgi:BirA family transcriptional regulator, biotin operon repressor / biotin---[acetyl-CoA-carboxylase] ligase
LSSANPFGAPFLELLTVESTNNYAMGLIHEGMARHGTAVFSHEQTKGKGQRNKQWFSEKNKNIALSLIIQPFSLAFNEAFLLSMSVALALQRFLNFYTNGDVTIKWPNDIYWRDRKAAGILIENVVQGSEWKWAVIGMGVNINQTNFGDFKRAVSLKQITGKDHNVIVLAKELLNYLQQCFDELINDKEDVLAEYHQHLYKWKEKIILKKGERRVEGVFKGVTKDGLLILQHEKEERFAVGEVEWVE